MTDTLSRLLCEPTTIKILIQLHEIWMKGVKMRINGGKQMKNNKTYYTIGTVQTKSNRNYIDLKTKWIPLIQIYMTAYILGFMHAVKKNGDVKLVLWAKIFLLSEMMWSSKCFPDLIIIMIAYDLYLSRFSVCRLSIPFMFT